jgi:NADPH-dependent curcumin reductase CurA
MALTTTCKTVTLINLVPAGLPGPENFEIVESALPKEDDVVEGGVLVKVLVMSAGSGSFFIYLKLPFFMSAFTFHFL